MKIKLIFLTIFLFLFSHTIFATECYCKTGNTEYYWSSNGKCSQATGKATRYTNGKEKTIVEASEAIDACG